MSRSASLVEDLTASTDKALSGYFKRSQAPLYGLVFLLPPLILFEVGTAYHPADTIALRKMMRFFSFLGATGRLVPALALVGVLLAWHIARKDSWRIQIDTLWGMLLESWTLALPLLLLGRASSLWHFQLPMAATYESWRDNNILSLGAGIYEEFVFRLVLMTFLMMLVSDVLRLPKAWANLLMVCASAVLFSLYHYLGSEPFVLQSFVFRTLAGIYFAILFLNRGFGVTSGCHIAYDLMVVSWQALAVR